MNLAQLRLVGRTGMLLKPVILKPTENTLGPRFPPAAIPAADIR